MAPGTKCPPARNPILDLGASRRARVRSQDRGAPSKDLAVSGNKSLRPEWRRVHLTLGSVPPEGSPLMSRAVPGGPPRPSDPFGAGRSPAPQRPGGSVPGTRPGPAAPPRERQETFFPRPGGERKVESGSRLCTPYSDPRKWFALGEIRLHFRLERWPPGQPTPPLWEATDSLGVCGTFVVPRLAGHALHAPAEGRGPDLGSPRGGGGPKEAPVTT